MSVVSAISLSQIRSVARLKPLKLSSRATPTVNRNSKTLAGVFDKFLFNSTITQIGGQAGQWGGGKYIFDRVGPTNRFVFFLATAPMGGFWVPQPQAGANPIAPPKGIFLTFDGQPVNGASSWICVSDLTAGAWFAEGVEWYLNKFVELPIITLV